MIRLDSYLVSKGYFESRQKAVFAIKKGSVSVNGKIISKNAFLIEESDQVDLVSPGLRYVSIGGLKLEKALRFFNYKIEGKYAIDIGASTGGFTDCLLQHGAAGVYCIDVGSNQLHPSLKENKKVKWKENCDIRTISANEIDLPSVDLIVVDVSFISIKNILADIKKFCHPTTKIIALIKPQFELENKTHFKNGIIKNDKLRSKVFLQVKEEFKKFGLTIIGETKTEVDNTKKNEEFLLFIKLL